MSSTDPQHPMHRLLQFSDELMAVTVLGIVLMLIVPLPTLLLYLLLVLNITASIITILISLSITEPL